MRQTQIKIAGYQGPRSILTHSLKAFAEEALPSATLTTDVTQDGIPAASLFAGLEAGEYHIGYLSSGYLAAQVPNLSVLDVPFSVEDRKSAYDALDTVAGEILRCDVHHGVGLTVLGFWDNGFRHISNRVRPIVHPRDCRGLTARTLDNQVYQDTLAALGFKPVVTDVKELKAAVATGRVDAQENPLTNLLGFGLDAWHNHVSLTGHIYGVLLFVANSDWFDALAKIEQDRIVKAAENATSLQRSLAAEDFSASVSALRARGIRLLQPQDIDLTAFRKHTAPVAERVLGSVTADIRHAYLEK